ncbi:hypothetical protein SDRG_02236 [Saprolegnia diclina VS20]|uniref:Uncharacterized protein n=1 Tax=Saprolegnia diclina (strain VS20) TaxID=1156394 RepID=T0R1W4_SAPDV|nr:hypothetical protein SDRG_02236 [Saprolegnia diclina VS20]EQC40335.1 hypothetical protein SDRG_02236 [Saprolegnia diclina VS20]|eukprot:XP_008606034.1 hypothetical protein SDRG_02236 [Saprolegnia diclina VS20]
MSTQMLELAYAVNSVHCTRSSSPLPIAPRLYIKAIDGELTFPLSETQLAALAAQYPAEPMRIPSSDISFVGASAHELVDGALRAQQLSALHPWGKFSTSFSDLVIDRRGSVLAWTRDVEPEDHTFGTMVQMLPSTARGGAVTITCDDDRSTTYETVDDSLVSLYSACDVSVMPIVSGYRAALVYRLHHSSYRYECDVPGLVKSMAPLPTPTVASMRAAAADVAILTHVAMPLYLSSHTSTFESLTKREEAIVAYLVATDAVDVALVGDGLPNTFHPACNVPTEVQKACSRYYGMRWFIPEPMKVVEPSWSYASRQAKLHPKPKRAYLAVWPKAHRVYFVGLDRTLDLMAAYTAGTSTDLLGLPSLRAVAAAVVLLWRRAVAPPTNGTSKRFMYRLSVTNTLWYRTGLVLLHHLRDNELTMSFLTTLTAELFWPSPDDVSYWFADVVDELDFGAVAAHVLCQIDAGATRIGDDAMYVRLLATFLWNTELRTAWPHGVELLHDGLHRLLARCGTATMDHATEYLVHALPLLSCIDEQGGDPTIGRVLASRLPAPVLAIVDSFVHVATPFLSIVAGNPSLSKALPVALYALRNTSLSFSLQPYIDLAVDVYRAPPIGCTADDDAALMALTAGTPPFDWLFERNAASFETRHWATALSSPNLTVTVDQASHVLAVALDSLPRSLPLTALSDETSLCDRAILATSALRICYYLKDFAALETVLQRVYAQQAKHASPITYIMDMLMPLHDACVEMGCHALAVDVATRCFRELRAYVKAALRGPPLPQLAWWCRCYTCGTFLCFMDKSTSNRLWHPTRGSTFGHACEYFLKYVRAGHIGRYPTRRGAPVISHDMKPETGSRMQFPFVLDYVASKNRIDAVRDALEDLNETLLYTPKAL